MKRKIPFLAGTLLFLIWTSLHAQTSRSNRLFIDVHIINPGSITVADVIAAHTKDLAVQGKYGVQFLKYWFDEKAGTVYCLSSTPDSASIADAHNEAHGLLPHQVYAVTDGKDARPVPELPYFLDIHNLGPGNVTAAAVAKAHKKDLAVQKKHGVNFINYWVCEEKGIVFCLSQTKSKSNIAETHKDAHGLIPAMVFPVIQGQ
jgi:hypothetical protein